MHGGGQGGAARVSHMLRTSFAATEWGSHPVVGNGGILLVGRPYDVVFVSVRPATCTKSTPRLYSEEAMRSQAVTPGRAPKCLYGRGLYGPEALGFAAEVALTGAGRCPEPVVFLL